MPVQTRRWDDPPSEGEGLRVLITRYRPRGLPKAKQTWDRWMPQLGPSKALHAAAYAKVGLGIGWAEYRLRYLTEMRAQDDAIEELAAIVRAGGAVALLCSSQCDREARCHRSLLRALIERRAAAVANQSATPEPPADD
jgi:uncharacterized protein YeaO (DUF488 family)